MKLVAYTGDYVKTEANKQVLDYVWDSQLGMDHTKERGELENAIEGLVKDALLLLDTK